MKLPLTFAALLLSFIAFAPAVKGQTCACEAPDKNCVATVTCPNGCTAICASNNKCFATCSGSPQVDKSEIRLSFEIKNKNSAQVAAVLSKHSRRNITFIPKSNNGPYNFVLTNDHYWEALRYFQEFGTVLVDGIPFYDLQEFRRKVVAGEKVGIDLKNRSIQGVVADLSLWSGKSFSVSAKAKRAQRFSIALKDVTLSEMIDRISAQTGVEIKERAEGAK